MKLIFTTLFIVISFQIFSQNNDTITVTGIAFNAKAGAVLQTKNGKNYYINNLSAWPADSYNKTITVSGILKKETFKQEDLVNEKGEWSQGMIGEKFTILKPKWEICVEKFKK